MRKAERFGWETSKRNQVARRWGAGASVRTETLRCPAFETRKRGQWTQKQTRIHFPLERNLQTKNTEITFLEHKSEWRSQKRTVKPTPLRKPNRKTSELIQNCLWIERWTETQAPGHWRRIQEIKSLSRKQNSAFESVMRKTERCDIEEKYWNSQSWRVSAVTSRRFATFFCSAIKIRCRIIRFEE